jgi:anti-sigma regulatory factor (Ser/Thr protein kinase)
MPEHRIRDRVDIYGARKTLKLMAWDLGFRQRECDELAIVLSELASNILKYGVHGSVRMEPLETGEPGIMLVARDFGRPFHDLAMALKDGYDDRGPIDPMHMLRRGGIGGGLGAIVRFSHSFHVETLPDGKAIEVVRYLRRPLGSIKITLPPAPR